MSFDLNVVVVRQCEAVKFDSLIDIQSEKNGNLRYEGIWGYMGQSSGIWYSLGKMEDDIFSAMPIIDTDFDKVCNEKLFWIEDEEVLSNLTPLIVNDAFVHEFDRIIREMVEMSPIKTILFMARYQGGETEIIHGVVPISSFLHLIKRNEILFNVCYIVKG